MLYTFLLFQAVRLIKEQKKILNNKKESYI